MTLAVLLFALGSQLGQAENQVEFIPGHCGRSDEIWLVSTRGMGCCRGEDCLERLRYYRSNNSCDPALKFYPMSESGRPGALGYTGLASPGGLGADRERIEQRDVCCVSGKCHDLECYLDHPSLMGHAWWNVSRGVIPDAASP